MVLKDKFALEVQPASGSEEVANVTGLAPFPSAEPCHNGASAEPPASRPSQRLLLVAECVCLALALGLAGWLRLWNLEQNRWGTTYYTAVVRSAMDSWHNFFYISFDPGGFVSVDKPPVALWVQILSAKIFGFSQFSVLAPQAVMGILSVLILWHLVRRRFGPLAAFLAALALAVMPISVAVERTNNTDACLAFVLLLSGWALIRAAEKGSLWLLLLSMLLVGIGFNTKMLAAFVVLPTYYLVYLFGAPVSWRSRLGDLALATFVVFGVSLSWAVIYDLTPEDSRPFVDSTQNNSMLTLIVEHNGLERFVRRGRGRGGPGAAQQRPARNAPNTANPGGQPANGAASQQPIDGQNAAAQAGPPAGRGQQGRGRRGRGGTGQAQGPATPGQGGGLGGGFPDGGPGFAGGPPLGPGPGPGGPGGRGGPGGGGGLGWGGGAQVGLWRLAHPHMAGQLLWFFPLAMIGFIAAMFQARWSWTLSPEHQMLLLCLGWLVTYGVVYSFAGGIFHDYYVSTMVAPMAALTGIGGAALWNSFQRAGWRSLLLPLAFLLTAAWQALIWLNYPEFAKWTVPMLFITATAAGLGLLALRGSWYGLVLTLAVLVCVGWLWSRDSEASDILVVAAGALETARNSLRAVEGWDSIKALYTKLNPDIGTALPDLRRQAPLVTPALLLGCAIAGGCLLLLFLVAKWRPIVAKATTLTAAVCFLALFVGPSIWALSPVWGTTSMLPSADPTTFARVIREREQRAQQAVRAASLVLITSNGTASLDPVVSATVVATDFTVFMRGQRDALAAGRGGRGPGSPGGGRGPGLAGGGRGPGLPPGGRGPGMQPRDDERSREDRQKMVAFLKANHDDERWLLAVSGHREASPYIIEDGLSVMAIGGFGTGSATLGTEPEEIKARLAKLVAEGQVRFFQIAGGPGGFGGGPGRQGRGGGRQGFMGPPAPVVGVTGPTPPQGPGRAGNPPPAAGGRGGNAAVSQWILEQVEKGKAKRVDRKLYASAEARTANPRGPGRGPGPMGGGGGDLYDLRPELGLREANP